LAFGKNFGNRALCIMIALGFVLIGPLGIIVSGEQSQGAASSRASSRATADDWPMFRYSANRNGVTTSHGPTTDSLLWSNTTTKIDGVFSSPAVVDGRVFYGSDDGKVYALDSLTGKRLWSNTTNALDYGASSSPAVHNGNVFYYSNGDDSLYCFNVTTGARKWKVALGSGGYGGSSPVIINNKVIVGSADGHLYIRNEADGSADWNYAIGASTGNGYGVESAPSIVGERVFFGGGDQKFYAVNTSSHALVWSYALAFYGYPSASVIGNVVYTADGSYASESCASCNVFAFDIDGFADGNDGWTGESLTGGTNGDIIWKTSMPTGTVSSPTYYKGYIYIGSMDNKVYALNSTDGTVKWSYTTGGDVMSSASVSDDIVYISSKDNKLYAFDYNGFADGNDGWTGETNKGASDGDILWNYTMSGESWASPAISNGIAYLTDRSGKIWAIGSPYVDTSPPKILTTYPVDKATNISLSTPINAHLSQALDPLTVTSVNFTLKESGGNLIPGTVSYDSGKKNITFNPNSQLKPHTMYSASIMNLKNLAGYIMASSFNWSFTTIDAKPVLSLGTVTPATGNLTTLFQFSVLYTDPDNDAPNTSVRLYLDGSTTPKTCILNTSATAAYHDGNFVNGEAYIYNTTFTTGGTHHFQFKVTDGFIENITQTLSGPQVVTPNLPPTFKTIPDQQVTEDIPYTFNLVPYVEDTDNTTAQLKLNVTFQYMTGVTGLNASFLFPNEALASYNIVFTVSDGITAVQKTVKFVVTHVDDAPVIAPLKDVTVNATEAYKYNIRTYITDIDTPLSAITLSTNSSYITVSGLNLTLDYPRSVTKELVNVSVMDGTNIVFAEFWVTVYAAPINLPPVIDALPDAAPTEDVNSTYDLAPYIHDDGLPSGQLTVTVKASKYVTRENLKIYMLYPDGVLTDKVNITVSDGLRNTTAVLKVNVKPVNDAPILKDGIMNQVFGPKNKKVPTSYSFDVTVGDIDSPDPLVWVLVDGATYQMTKGNKTTITEGGQTISAYHYTYVITNSLLAKGAHTFKFKVDDKSAATNAVQETPSYNFDVVKAKKTTTNPMSGLLPILLIVVILVVVLAIVAAVMMKRKKGPAAAMPPQGQAQQVDLMAQPPQQYEPAQLPQQYAPTPMPEALAPVPEPVAPAPAPMAPPVEQPAPPVQQPPAPPTS
jgi:outer membrane protein assembly factor BamB